MVALLVTPGKGMVGWMTHAVAETSPPQSTASLQVSLMEAKHLMKGLALDFRKRHGGALGWATPATAGVKLLPCDQKNVWMITS